MKQNLEKKLLVAVKDVVAKREKQYIDDYYRSPGIFHQPKRPKK